MRRTTHASAMLAPHRAKTSAAQNNLAAAAGRGSGTETASVRGFGRCRFHEHLCLYFQLAEAGNSFAEIVCPGTLPPHVGRAHAVLAHPARRLTRLPIRQGHRATNFRGQATGKRLHRNHWTGGSDGHVADDSSCCRSGGHCRHGASLRHHFAWYNVLNHPVRLVSRPPLTPSIFWKPEGCEHFLRKPDTADVWCRAAPEQRYDVRLHFPNGMRTTAKRGSRYSIPTTSRIRSCIRPLFR